jgi:hypothetical protein
LESINLTLFQTAKISKGQVSHSKHLLLHKDILIGMHGADGTTGGKVGRTGQIGVIGVTGMNGTIGTMVTAAATPTITNLDRILVEVHI